MQLVSCIVSCPPPAKSRKDWRNYETVPIRDRWRQKRRKCLPRHHRESHSVGFALSNTRCCSMVRRHRRHRERENPVTRPPSGRPRDHQPGDQCTLAFPGANREGEIIALSRKAHPYGGGFFFYYYLLFLCGNDGPSWWGPGLPTPWKGG